MNRALEVLKQLMRQPSRLLAIMAALLVLNLVALLTTSPTSRVATGPMDSTGPNGAVEGGPTENLPAEAGTEGAATRAGSRSKSAAKGGILDPQVAVTENEIKIGVEYQTDPGAAASAAGFTLIGQINQKRAWETLIAQLNQTRPGGRVVVPVEYAWSQADFDSKGQSGLDQEMCARWTRDNKVFAAWGGGPGDTLKACLTKAGIAQVSAGLGYSYSKTFLDYPYMVEPATPGLDRMAGFLADRLEAAAFFTGFKDDVGLSPPHPGNVPKIGLFRYDEPAYRTAAAALKSELSAEGLGLCQGCEFAIVRGASSEEQIAEATQINAAVDGCKDKECTHIVFIGSIEGARIPLFAVQRLESQRYRPRLGFSSFDAPRLILNNLGPASYGQFRKSMVVGWSPFIDIGSQTPGHGKCIKTLQDAGETFGGTDDTTRNKEAQVALYCDTAWYFRGAMNAMGRTVTTQSWLSAVANVGQLESAGTFVMQTKADRHDGASAIRIAEWDEACNCHKYTTDVIPI